MPTKSPAGSPEWTDPDDAPVLTEAEVRDVEIFEGNSFVRRGRGRPKTGNAKELISVRLDQDVVAELRKAGPGWQSQVNALLRQGLSLNNQQSALHPAFLDSIRAALDRITPINLLTNDESGVSVDERVLLIKDRIVEEIGFRSESIVSDTGQKHNR